MRVTGHTDEVRTFLAALSKATGWRVASRDASSVVGRSVPHHWTPVKDQRGRDSLYRGLPGVGDGLLWRPRQVSTILFVRRATGCSRASCTARLSTGWSITASRVGRRPASHSPESSFGIVRRLHAVEISAPRREGKAKMQSSEVSRAVAAAMSAASGLGLTVDDATVLHNSNKLALRLLPCDVFARVAHVGQEVAQLEVELALRLAETGSPVAALEPRVEPRVYERDGFVVTLWTYYESVAPPEVSPADYANALERLHAGMRKLDVTTPHFTDRVAEAQQLVASRDLTPALADADRELLSTHASKPETSDQRPRCRRTAAARRTAPRQRARHEERAAVHRPRDVLPWACRIRPRPCARSGQRPLSGR